MVKEIYYIGYNTYYGNPNKVVEFPSCNSKMQYIIESLEYNGFRINVFSLGQGVLWKRQVRERVSDNLNISYVATIPNKGMLSLFSKLFLVIQICFFILFKVEKNSKVIVYHSFHLSKIFKFLKKIKELELIYEVEEIYKAAWGKSQLEIDKEIKSIEFADKYLFVNDILAKKVKNDRPFLICYGNYNVVKCRDKKNDLINIVYAGIIGDFESDVYLAVDSMKFLPSYYVLKVVGYGNDINLQKFKDYILHHSNVEYDGLLRGHEYSNYLLKCHIGISPRKLDNLYSDYTFPSKILVYLGHHLHVVTTKIDCIIKSEISNDVYFIDNITPQDVAKTIQLIDIKKEKSNVLVNLDYDFKRNLKNLIEK